jgi:hypothetical protein
MVSQHLKTLVMFSISIASVTLLIYLIVSPPGVSFSKILSKLYHFNNSLICTKIDISILNRIFPTFLGNFHFVTLDINFQKRFAKLPLQLD